MQETTLRPINLTPTRHHKIISDYGVSDYYWYYRKRFKNPRINQKLYRRLLRELNTRIHTEIVNKPYDYRLPRRLGYIKVRKYYPQFSVIGSTVIKNKMMIDWPRTMRLWIDDPSAYDDRVFMYYENEHSDGFVFKIKYDKSHAVYKNKSVYMFLPTREMKALLSKNIDNKTIDAFLS